MFFKSGQEEKGSAFYPYLIVISCIVMCAMCSLMVNCTGIYLKPVSAFFHISSAEFMLYFTILQLAMALTLPIAGKLMNHMDSRVLFSSCAILCVMGNLVMSFTPAIFGFYIAAIMLGAGTAPMLFLAVPKLIGAWFVKRVGFFTGLCLSFLGIGGMVFNPLQSILINTGPEGWRSGYFMAALVILFLTLPFTLFIVRDNPENKGMRPVGIDSLDEKRRASFPKRGVLAQFAIKTPAFFAIALFGGLIALNQTVFQFLPAYCLSFSNTSPSIAGLSAVVASVCMAGLSIGKISLGYVNDKTAKGGVSLSMGFGIVGVLLMLFMPNMAATLLTGSFLFGFVYAATTVQTTLLTREVFGSRDYATIYSRASVVSSLGGAFAATLWGVIVDLPNGFALMFEISLGIMVISFCLGLFALSKAKYYRAVNGEEVSPDVVPSSAI